MRLVSFSLSGRSGFGALVDGGVAEFVASDEFPYDSVLEVLRGGGLGKAAELATTSRTVHLTESVSFLPPIAHPTKILCVGVNYATHLEEAQRAGGDYPPIFTRFFDTQVGHHSPIVRPSNTTMFDYEGELAVVISRACSRVDASEALHYVAGYACYNDATARDWQRHSSQWGPGKNFPATGAFGPALVTADEVGDLASLELVTRVNGEVRQQAPLSSLIFSVPELIAYISGFTPLSPGDVIVTGTPGGVGLFMEPPQFLDAGDVVEVEISGIGLLVNSVVDE